MNGKMVVAVMIASCLWAGNAFCGDWKLYGVSSPAAGTTEYMFYDTGTVLDANGSVKLWIKTVLSDAMEKVSTNAAVVERAAAKVAKGYVPPITGIYGTIANAALLEEAANEPSLRSRAEILYQIDCREKKYRTVSGATFNKVGLAEFRFGISKWDGIAPKSNADNLVRMVCGPK